MDSNNKLFSSLLDEVNITKDLNKYQSRLLKKELITYFVWLEQSLNHHHFHSTIAVEYATVHDDEIK